jgi:hypothetical protein
LPETADTDDLQVVKTWKIRMWKMFAEELVVIGRGDRDECGHFGKGEQRFIQVY